MIDYEKIKRYVSDLLTLSGLDLEGKSAAGTLLFHAYVAVAMFELMDERERALIKGVQRRMKYFFFVEFQLKREKEKNSKRDSSPYIPIYRKRKQRKRRENYSLCGARSLFASV